MFRYHSSSNSVRLGDPYVKARFDDDTLTGCVIPIWSRETNERVRTLSDEYTGAVSSDLTRRIVDTRTHNIFLYKISDNINDVGQRLIDGSPHCSLPIILVPDPDLSPSRQSAVVDALITGAVNSTTGAMAGAGIGFLFGGPGGAWVGAACGGAILGGGTAIAQFVSTMGSNSFREAVARCNDVLITARGEGITGTVIEKFTRARAYSVTSDERNLVRQVLEAFEREFGVDAAAELRVIYNQY